MKTINMMISLTYDAEIMHDPDEEGRKWFIQEVLGNGLFLHSNEIGDIVGEVKVLPMLGIGGCYGH